MASNPRIVPFSRNARFLEHIFNGLWSQALVAWFPGDPETQANWVAYPATALPDEARQRSMNTYFCPSLVRGTQRQISEFVSFHVIVVDDIGTKVTLSQAEAVLGPPSYLIETSSANFQAGWHTETITDLAWVKGMLKRLKEILGAGDNLTDPMIWRRLPVGINGKAKHRDSLGRPWPAVMLSWNPRAALSQADLDVVLGTITPANIQVSGTGEMPDPGEIEADVVLEALHLLGRVLDHIRPTTMGWGFDIECPWSENHSDRTLEGAVYVPVKGRFHCHHGHCQDRTMADLRQRVDVLLREDSGGLDCLAKHEFDDIELLMSVVSGVVPGPGDQTAVGRSLASYEATEDGLALAFAAEHEGKLRFDGKRKKWFVWTGGYWRQDDTERAFVWARKLLRQYRKGAQDLTPGQARAWGKIAAARAIEQAARAQLAVNGETCWDQDIWLAGAPGCEVDLRTGAVVLPDPAHGITKQLKVTPDPRMPTPLWDKFLWESTGGDIEMIAFLQAWYGYNLTGDVAEEKFVFEYGTGGNGKGTLLYTISAILNDYARRCDVDMFMVRKYKPHSEEVARLHGVRMVSTTESEDGRTFDVVRLKDFTGRDGKLTGRFMRTDSIDFTAQFKLTFVGNNQPRLPDVDEAMRRRLVLVPFTQTPMVPDITLKDRLVNEYPGILAWLIEGEILRKTSGGLSSLVPERAKLATKVYLADQDTLQKWVEDHLEAEHE